MRTINVDKIRGAVKDLCLRANFELPADILCALKKALRAETGARARNILKSIIDNADLARKKGLAICQDTGFVSIFVDIGRDVRLAGGSLEAAINYGVEDAYEEGYLRKSVVGDPVIRKNTGTNTPASISAAIVEGANVSITVSPKGFGSENKSKIMMFNPADTIGSVKKFIVDTAISAGPSACPPLVIGVGMGGTFDKAAFLAKKALLRPIDKPNPNRHISLIEKDILRAINSSGMGPMGLGGKTTALGVNILEHPTHIAGLPVAVNISCHATRRAGAVL